MSLSFSRERYQYGTFGINWVYCTGLCNKYFWIGSRWIRDHKEFLKIAKPRSSHSPMVLGKYYLKREKVFRAGKHLKNKEFIFGVFQRENLLLGLTTAQMPSLMQMRLKTLTQRRRHLRRRRQVRSRSRAHRSSMRLCLLRRNPYMHIQRLPRLMPWLTYWPSSAM